VIKVWVCDVEVPGSNVNRFFCFLAVLITLAVSMLQLFCYYSVTISVDHEIQCLGYLFANFQSFIISSLLLDVKKYYCYFLWKWFITLQFCLYLKQIWYQDAPYIHFNVCQIWRQSDYLLAFITDFCKCANRRKKKKNMKKVRDFLMAHISGMASMI